MNKTLLFILLSFLSFSTPLYAQQSSQISGNVTASETGEAFPGVTVQVKGTKIGTISDANGAFQISAASSATTLIFSAIGMQTVEEAISGRNVINISLNPNSEELNEVIITALGIKGERDKFASSVSTLEGKTIARSGETSLLTGLSGKTSGVLITRNGGDPGAGAYIQIRGQNTINGSAQPLFIVDGVPVSNASDNAGTAANNGIIQQSRINDINPEDIERMEVLKGASAAALWGTRAANGVIVITTKKGQNTNGKVNITFKSTISFDRVNKMPALQRTYGQGLGGLYQQGNRNSFGDLISDRSGGQDTYTSDPSAAGYQGVVVFPDGTSRYAIAPGTAAYPHGGKNDQSTYDHTKDVFQTGHFTDNSLNISGGDSKSTFLVSYSNLNQDGVIKAFSNYKRNTARVNVGSQFTTWLRASANVGYTKVQSSRVQEGDNVDGIMLGGLRTPPDFDNSKSTGTFTNPAGQVFNDAHVSYRNPLGKDLSTIYSNPLWNINNNKNTSDVDRLIGTLQLDITPVSWLNITGRTGVDNFTDNRLERFSRNSALYTNGFLSKNWISEKQFNTDVFAVANTTFNNDFSGSLLLGVNYNSRRRATLSGAISNLIVPSAPDILTNALNSNLSANNYNSLIRTYAYYAQADLQAYDMLFLTLTGRSESASTFGSKTKNSFFFPSAALAWQFTKLNALADNDFLSFGKLRLTLGQVGIQPQPYQNFTTFGPAFYGDKDTFTRGLSSASTLYGGGYVRSTTAGNDFLRPERKSETEIGVDLRFLNNKITFSATGYSNRTKDVILALNVPSGTGYTIRNVNAAALSNKGLELDASANVLSKGDFNWNLSANFSLNRSNVVSLAGASNYTLPDSYMQNSSLIPGQPFGIFYSTDFQKNESGAYALDANGFPQGGTQSEIIGDPNPKWRGGLGSTFAFKNLSLFVLFDRIAGNDFFNGTRGSLYNFGTHGDQGHTVVAPAGGLKDVNGNTIAEGTSFQGQIKDFGGGPVAINQAWWQGRGTASTSASYKQFVEDASATRLREVTLTYSLKSAAFRRFTHLSNVDFSITGRNLVLWTKYTGTDPEVNISGAGLSRGQDWFTNPNTKSILFSVRVMY
ncbi:SusC/RagA family TonB-linked outer membrane protein [Dyadobacter sp. CY347]|uniref:SusC/RagA family TonB-linked outer membrane protein n=1 Tax=Dyadobacter sp. CY347 TaxID=2909336 RepID=UPI001F40A341|nr:SusC/RagA family TonB-linked outer membrane protein [Dyadobacter sp. CY347]MCF2488650.1 SusC/RagA family TonB-linked outer membrane protein [Dyadobacter sp. CY347]